MIYMIIAVVVALAIIGTSTNGPRGREDGFQEPR